MPPATGSGCREGVRGERTEVTLHPAQSPGRALQAQERGQHAQRLGTCMDHVWCFQHDPKVGTDTPVRHAAWLVCFHLSALSSVSLRVCSLEPDAPMVLTLLPHYLFSFWLIPIINPTSYDMF